MEFFGGIPAQLGVVVSPLDLVENDEKWRIKNRRTREMEGLCPFVFRIFLVECWQRSRSTAVDVVGGASDGCLDGESCPFRTVDSLGDGHYAKPDAAGAGASFCASFLGFCRKQGQIGGVGGRNKREKRGVLGEFSNHFVVCLLQQEVQRSFGGSPKDPI